MPSRQVHWVSRFQEFAKTRLTEGAAGVFREDKAEEQANVTSMQTKISGPAHQLPLLIRSSWLQACAALDHGRDLTGNIHEFSFICARSSELLTYPVQKMSGLRLLRGRVCSRSRLKHGALGSPGRQAR